MKYLVWFLLICNAITANNLTWSFPPFVASTPGVDAMDPHIAIHSNGDVTLVWEENGVIQARSKPSSGGWEAITTLAASNSSDPRIVIHGTGEATAIWNEGGFITTASRPFGGSWQSATTLSFGGAASPRIAVNSSNDLVACWTRLGNIESATKLSGGNWPSSADVIASTSAENPQVALGGLGGNEAAIIVWEGPGATNRVIRSANKLILDVWNAQQTISNPAIDSRNPDVAIDDNGNATAIWFRYTELDGLFSNVAVEDAKKPEGAPWEPEETLSFDAGIKNPETLMLKVLSQLQGETLAMWANSLNGSTFDISARLGTPRIGDWDDRESKITINNLYSFAFDFDLNSFGNAYSAYMFFTSTGELIILSSGLYLAAHTPLFWSPAQVLSTGPTNAFPSISANFSTPTHRAAAAWVNSDGTNTEIHVRIGEGPIVEPPTGLAVQQSSTDFGSFIEYFNTLTWTDSTSSNIRYYAVHRNGIFLDVVNPGVEEFIDHNQEQGGNVSYEVSTVDKQNFQSQEATVTFP